MKKLGFGLMRLPKTDPNVNKSVDETAVLQMMREFIDNGFTYFDTAYMYHSYTSENVVGRTLVKNFPRDSFTLADKLPTMFLKEADDMQRIFEEQLTKCCVDYFDYYMLHDVNGSNYDQTVQRLRAFDFISKLKAEGIYAYKAYKGIDSYNKIFFGRTLLGIKIIVGEEESEEARIWK